MTKAIEVGTILIDQGTQLPAEAAFKSDTQPSGWTAVRDLDAYQLDREIRKTGWSFFYMSSEIRIDAFGFDREKALARAMNRAMVDVRLKKCNCLEVTGIRFKRLLGLPYVRLSVHPRHIQQSMFFGGEPSGCYVEPAASEPNRTARVLARI